MTQREDLLEIGSVRIPIEIYRAQSEGCKNGRQIIGRERHAVERRLVSQGASACGDVLLGNRRGPLQRRAIPCARLSRAAVVHQQQIALGEQRLKEPKVLVARLRGGKTGAAFGCDKSSQRLARCRVRVELE